MISQNETALGIQTIRYQVVNDSAFWPNALILR